MTTLVFTQQLLPDDDPFPDHPVQAQTARITCRVCELKDDVPLTHAPDPLCRACAADVGATRVKVRAWLDGVLAQMDAELDRWDDLCLSYPAFWAKLEDAKAKAGDDHAVLTEGLCRARAAHPTYARLLDAEQAMQRALEPLGVERARLERALELLDELAPQLGPGEYLIPAGVDVEACRSCGANIVWAKTPAGKAVPLSLALVEERNGQRITKTHFVDCKDSREWRRT